MLPQEAPRLHCLYTNINLCFLRFHDLISLFLESGNAVLCSPFIMASTCLNIAIKFKSFDGCGFNLWKVRMESTRYLQGSAKVLEKYVTKCIIYGRYKTFLFASGSLILVPCSTALSSKECFLSFRASNIGNDTCNIDGFYVIRLAM